uniref:Uncharacterized protein n=1 Tax=Anguilla anguilla TaxID=7936 RepID=A0A0E9UTE1_ANGAN
MLKEIKCSSRCPTRQSKPPIFKLQTPHSWAVQTNVARMS